MGRGLGRVPLPSRPKPSVQSMSVRRTCRWRPHPSSGQQTKSSVGRTHCCRQLPRGPRRRTPVRRLGPGPTLTRSPLRIDERVLRFLALPSRLPRMRLVVQRRKLAAPMFAPLARMARLPGSRRFRPEHASNTICVIRPSPRVPTTPPPSRNQPPQARCPLCGRRRPPGPPSTSRQRAILCISRSHIRRSRHPWKARQARSSG